MAKVLKIFFALFFAGKICPWESHVPETGGKMWNNEGSRVEPGYGIFKQVECAQDHGTCQ